MIGNITIGQYFPGDSPVHRLDPRAKILLTIVYIVAIFMCNSPAAFVLSALFLVFITKLSSIPFVNLLRGLKSILFIIAFTGIFNLFMTSGEPIFTIGPLTATYEGLAQAVKMVLRVFFLITGTTLLTFTTSPIRLTDGIEHLLSPFSKIGLPSHELAMMMSIALRFIPTLIEETDKIMKAQSARGADFHSGGLIKRAKSFVPILVPLFISSFRRADELAVAMECRCYRGGSGRTRLVRLKFEPRDAIAALVCVGFLAAVICIRTWL